jgi:hypothetical protein
MLVQGVAFVHYPLGLSGASKRPVYSQNASGIINVDAVARMGLHR